MLTRPMTLSALARLWVCRMSVSTVSSESEMLGIYADAVARMHARPFDVLHDAGDEDVLPVANGVHFDLGAHHVLVDQDGVLLLRAVDDGHELHDIGLVVRDLMPCPPIRTRGAAARIPQTVGRGNGLFGLEHGLALRARHAALLEDSSSNFCRSSAASTDASWLPKMRTPISVSALHSFDGGLPAHLRWRLGCSTSTMLATSSSVSGSKYSTSEVSKVGGRPSRGCWR